MGLELASQVPNRWLKANTDVAIGSRSSAFALVLWDHNNEVLLMASKISDRMEPEVAEFRALGVGFDLGHSLKWEQVEWFCDAKFTLENVLVWRRAEGLDHKKECSSCSILT